jgi:P4 family phage/plasmid primase-like protien
MSSTSISQNATSGNTWYSDLGPTWRYLAVLVGNDRNLTLQAIPDKKKGRPVCAPICHANLYDGDLLDRLFQWNGEGFGIFIMVNEGDGQGRRRENVVSVRAVFVDLDGAPLEPVLDAPLRPHIVVETSPGRFHVYWKVQGLSLNNFSRVQRELARRFGGDLAVSDLPRLMRLPGFHHRKGDAFPVELQEAHEHPPYSANDFLEAFGIDLDACTERRPGTRSTAVTGNVIPFLSRNATLTRVAGAMRRHGATEEAIEAALQIENEQRCYEPLTRSEVATIARSVSSYEPAPQTFDWTDLGNAQRLVSRHGEDLRYCRELGWLVWDRTRWIPDKAGEIDRRAKDTARSILGEAEHERDLEKQKKVFRHAINSQNMLRIKAMIEAAQSEAEIPVRPEQLDSDPFLLNCMNGTIDLRTGELIEHRRDDLITKIVPVNYSSDAECPLWESFLDRIFSGNQGLISFVQEVLGYSLTGDTQEQCWFFCYGTGANGKSTLFAIVRHVMGDYAAVTPADALLDNRNHGVRSDLARLKGVRLTTASEPNAGRKLDESLIKELTGGEDQITVRHLYKEFFEFKPQFKLFLAANHKPRVSGVDNGFWRRVKQIPFDVRIPDEEQDKTLPEKLRAEAAGILRWMVEGCLRWQRGGLQTPEEVREAVQDYRDESDVLKDFLDDNPDIVKDADSRISVQGLYAYYVEHCEMTGEKPLSRNSFGRRMTEKDYKKERYGKDRRYYWQSISLRNDLREPTKPKSDDIDRALEDLL